VCPWEKALVQLDSDPKNENRQNVNDVILPASVLQRICYTVVDEHAGNWGISTSKALGDGLDVRYNAFVLPRMKRATSAHPRHDLCLYVSTC